MPAGLSDLEFTVAICTLDRKRHLERAIDALLVQLRDFPKGRLLVVDNGSTDGTREYLAQLERTGPHVATVGESEKGLFFARVRAITEATGEFLFFLDDDAVPQPGWLAGMLRQLTSAADVGVVGCAIDSLWETERPAWLSDRMMREIPVYDIAEEQQEARFPAFPAGTALGLRLNECARLYAGSGRRGNYPLGRKGTPRDGARYRLLGGEDTDLCEIYARNGYRVLFTNGARIHHAVTEERLDPAWFLRKFASEGQLRIRMLRLAGYPVWGPHSNRMLAFLPAFALLYPFAAILPSDKALLVRAYFHKCLGAWRELLGGERFEPFSFKCDGQADG